MKNKLNGKNMLLGIQHLLAMFGATVAVPLATGMSVSMALVCAGIGTLIFHWVTGGKVPVFLGSSFAYLGAITAAVNNYGIEYAQGGIIVAGCVYIVLAIIIKFVGIDIIKKLFPPVVTGPIIVVIGLSMCDYAVSTASANWGIALFVLAVVVAVSIFTKGFFKLVPLLFGIVAGYVLCLILDLTCGTNFVNFAPIAEASWLNIPYVTDKFFTIPQFDLGVILSIAPIAMVTFMEHIGDITTNGAVVGKDFFKDPGLSRTILGDGLATAFAGLIGGPANTTYSENTGVLATTGVYDPFVLRLAAVFAIILGFCGKFGAVLQSIPDAVKGGVFIMLFGMIAAIGIRTLAESKLDFTYSRNLMIVAIILIIGLGVGFVYSDTRGIPIQIGAVSISISGLFMAVVIGVILNLVLPQKPDVEEKAGQKAE